MKFISYSQNFEDVMLWRALGRHVQNGFFIDVGAWSPDIDSVTRAFSERGWSGINIEPNPHFHSQLMKRRKAEINLCVAVGDRTGTTTINIIEETGLSTVDDTIAKAHQASGWTALTAEVPITTLDAIWKQHVPESQSVHFLKIDVEGFEKAVIAGNDWNSNRPWVVVVEATQPLSQIESHQDWEPLLLAAGYLHCYSDGLNRYYVAHEHSELSEFFRFPPNVFDDFISAETVLQTTRADAGAHAQQELANVQVELARFRAESEDARIKQANAEKQERDVRRRAGIEAAALRASLLAHEVQLKEANQQTALAIQARLAIENATWWRATGPLRSLATKTPMSMQRQIRRAMKAAWWTLTPWKMPQRLRFIRNRSSSAHSNAPVSHKILQSRSETESPGLPVSGQYESWIATTESRSAVVAVNEPASMVSFLIFGVDSHSNFLKTMESIRAQSIGKWEAIVCQVEAVPELRVNIERSILDDFRFSISKLIFGAKSECLREALQNAGGEYIAILDSGDLLAPHALNEIYSSFKKSSNVDILYSDEDEQTSANARALPYFKPGWSPDTLYAFNYFGRLTLLRRSIVLDADLPSLAGDAALEWELNLRISDRAQSIQRLPKVLCHRKVGGVRERPAPQTPAAADSERVIERYWKSHGFEAIATTQQNGTQRVDWPFDKAPLVSIVIPTKDKVDLLRMCLNGVLHGTDYVNKEVVIVDTGSTEDATRAYYEELSGEASVKIVNFEKKFNYSAACNYGASYARGEIFLFLNNDIEIISSDWLDEMVRFAVRPGVGVVGTKLVYPSRELQHAGVGVGIHLCALMYRSAAEREWGIFGSTEYPRNWLAIMGACQMVRRDAFEQVGGFDDSYLVAMSDVALCLRIWRAGYRVAYAPNACLVHHEGATRGNSNPPEDIQRIADDIRDLGIDEDHYLHPEMDGTFAIPTLRTTGSRDVREELAMQIAAYGSFRGAAESLDLTDDGDCLDAAGLPRTSVVWLPQEHHKIVDKWSAARWCIDLLRRRADLRVRFPKAISDGASGAFPKWLCAEGPRLFGLPCRAVDAIRELFLEDIGAAARQLFLFRADVRAVTPHGLTPPGSRELFRWFMQHGREQSSLRLEEIWWLFWSARENPSRELVNAYLFTPTWQKNYPDALTIFGRGAFTAWFSAMYRVSGEWVDPSRLPITLTPAQQIRQAYQSREYWQSCNPAALHSEQGARSLLGWLRTDGGMQGPDIRAWCEALDESTTIAGLMAPGVNVIGHFCYPSGLRVSAEALVDGLQRVGIETSLRDVRTDQRDDPHHASFNGPEIFDTTIIHTQPEPFFSEAYTRSDVSERQPRTYRIAYWYWEFDSIPDFWLAHAATIDEVWTATEFIAKGLRERLSIPVKTLFPGVKLGQYKPRKREYFGLKNGQFTFLFTFHMMSIMERKNPLGLIRAFKSVFSPADDVRLVLKTSFGERHPAQLAELREAAHGSNITIIDKVFSPDEVLSLMDAADAYVSLHRSEGLGLTMAEAMLMGKPVIATNFSGNVDFMDSDNSLLVPYKLVKLGKPIPPYEASLEWAEPSVEEAARLMRQVFENQAWAREIGARAKISAEANLSLEAAGRRVAARLKEIGTLRRP
ncbi:FkbM family methyltransferase [Variovorax ginsengisoli]|uniref:FkbM family methyltransferase n=1 Tax=Variovorax ginsengisoli TaxID=363844 RepID=A0ABT9SB46_9BURK|nr:FkbM family methyltransferase [Variovorax ginsengisoli]MDP9901568.1 FkbM family methyltransferase [Variovorax ginsengisoli]